MTLRKLLVVDGDEMVLKLLACTLGHDFTVVTTDDPFAVPQMVLFDRPEAVVCEMEMSGLTGGELANLLEGDHRTRGVPIIFLTALVDQSSLRRYGSMIGGRPAIAKNAPVAELVSFVRQACDRPRSRRPVVEAEVCES